MTWDEDGVISTEKFGQIHMSHISDLIRDGIKSDINFSPVGQDCLSEIKCTTWINIKFIQT